MNTLTIFYDNFCPHCTRFARFIKKFDRLHLILIKELRNQQHIAHAQGIDTTLAEQQMASFDGQWVYGYPTLYKIFLRVPVFWALLPLFWILKISRLGQVLYLQLAVRRKIIPLHCDEHSCEHPQQNKP